MTTLPQRPLRGSRIATFYPIKSLPSLSSLDSAFQLQEYISLLIRLDVNDVEAIVSLPGRHTGKDKEKDGEGMKEWDKDKEKDDEGTGVDGEDPDDRNKSDVTVDEACWIYEQLRRLAQDLTHPLITMLQQECTRSSCPEMKAGEWLYLCVAHGNDGATEQCCAIDYILHTLDSATALLNTPRAFPSRLQIPQSSHRHFSSLARRLGRIFAHAYFHHREAFEQAEAESSLYARFLALTSKFELVPPEFLVIPQRIDTSDERGDREHDRDFGVQPPRLLSASVDTRATNERDIHQQQHQQLQHQHQQHQLHRNIIVPGAAGMRPWDRQGGVASAASTVERSKGGSPLGLRNGNNDTESPRKVGRNRTDTMVLHEPFTPLEEPKAEVEEKERPSSVNDSTQETETDITTHLSSNLATAEPQEDLPSITDGFSDSSKPHVGLSEDYQHVGDSLPESPIIKSPPANVPVSLPPTTELDLLAMEADRTEDKPETAADPASSDPGTVDQATTSSVEDIPPIPALPTESVPAESDIVEEAVAAVPSASVNLTTSADPPSSTDPVLVDSEATDASQDKRPEPTLDADLGETDKAEEEHPTHSPPSEGDAAPEVVAAVTETEVADTEHTEPEPPIEPDQDIPVIPDSVDDSPQQGSTTDESQEKVKDEQVHTETLEAKEETNPVTKSTDNDDTQQEKVETPASEPSV